jgi:hypothetical protein
MSEADVVIDRDETKRTTQAGPEHTYVEAEQTALLARTIDRLGNRAGLPPLMPDGPWHPGIDTEIANVSLVWLSAERADGVPSAAAYLAALHLWNDNLSAAHEIVQSAETPAAMLLHGIVHRREGDYDNARYWFRQAGNHPAYHGLQVRVAAYLKSSRPVGGAVGDALEQMAAQGSWNPYLFVSAAAMLEYRTEEREARARLEYVQQLELEAAMRFLEGNLGALRDE